MHKYFIVYNNQTNLDANVLIQTRPSRPSPSIEYEEIEIPGGDMVYKDKGYKDIEIPIYFNFASKNKNDWDSDFRKIKKWLLSKIDNKLIFSDDLNYFYKVKRLSIETPERVLKRIGRFIVLFICEPYSYYTEGYKDIELSSSIYNHGILTKPIYKITGEGLLTIKVNGSNIKANVGQRLIIDTNLGLCYRNDNSINNVALSGAYEDLWLKEGTNTFEWSSGFEIKIMPNWRCL